MTTIPINFIPEPDIRPLYPSQAALAQLLSPNSGLSPQQKSTLVSHSLQRACCFGDLSLLSYLLSDPLAMPHVDLDVRDEDGLGLISVSILGFGGESERDMDREECVRLLIAEGADVTTSDKAGWTPLHYASLLSPPTLVSHLITHGSSPLTLTRRQLTPLDIITAYSLIPGREDIALLLEEAMRGEGWQGGGRQEQRKRLGEKLQLHSRKGQVREGVGKTLGLDDRWWGDDDMDSTPEASDDEDVDEGYDSDTFATPPATYKTMLVFSPPSLPQIFHSLITSVRPSLRHSEPAKALYLHARFACIACDHNWLEDLLVGAVDKIEESAYASPEDLPRLTFWLFNTTTLLHLLRCDADVSETCEILGLFNLIEELINVIYVFIIRVAERRIDRLLDAAILDHSPLASEFNSVQFESEWSFLRSFTTPKKKPAGISTSISTPSIRAAPTSASSSPSTRPPSPCPQPVLTPSGTSRFSSLRQTFTRKRASSAGTHPPVSAIFPDSNSTGFPLQDLSLLLTALYNLLSMSGVNPALITQTFSQVMYWTSCEIFNRILTRKKYLCRSRAIQIGINLSVLEEWVVSVALPRAVSSHLNPVRELLGWLQCLSSIGVFANLVATIQTMRSLNPLQMRRAVRDYRYEVGEGRMTEECNQYLAQLQKDWERRRVKLGVEAIRKEIGERDRERELEESASSLANDAASTKASSMTSSGESSAQRAIDLLFSRTHEKSEWVAPRAPEVLGELLDARYMLPLVLPSDPANLSALPPSPLPPTPKAVEQRKRESFQLGSEERSASRASIGSRGAMKWRSKQRKLREVGVELLDWVDGVGGRRWHVQTGTGPTTVNGDEEADEDKTVSFMPELLRPDSPHLTENPTPRKERRSARGSVVDERPLVN